MKTEAEARQCWCPFARVVEVLDDEQPVEGYPVGNRSASGQHGHPRARCVGTECMAWRWDMSWESSTEEGQSGDLVVRLKRRQDEPKRGYCGLAGQSPF